MRPLNTRTNRLLTTLVCAAFVASCQALPVTSTGPAADLLGVAPATDNVLLTGRVEIPGVRRLLATSEDVARVSTVTLLRGGVPVSSGITDADGVFTLYKSSTPFVPAVDELFTLEVSRRHEASNERALLSLRTLVQYTGTGFTSITGKSIIVSPVTTAIAGLPEYMPIIDLPELLIDAAPFGIAADIYHPALSKEDGDAKLLLQEEEPLVKRRVLISARMIRAIASTITTRLRANIDPGMSHPTTNRGDDVMLVFEGDVEAFKTKLNRLRYVEVIKGDLTIVVPPEVVEDELGETALPHLKSVKGNVHFHDGGPGALKWLGSLKHVGGDLVVVVGESLEDLSGLEALDTVRGDLVLTPFGLKRSAPSADYTLQRAPGGLTDISALRNLRYIGGELEIASAPRLESLGDEGVGLESLKHLGGLRLQDTRVTNLDGLAGAQIGPDTDFGVPKPDLEPGSTGKEAWFDLNALDTSTRSKTPSIVLEGNGALSDLSGLANTAGALGHLVITHSPDVTDLSAFSQVTSADNLTVSHVGNAEYADLESLNGLGGLTSVRDLQITDCYALTDLSALSQLASFRDVSLGRLTSLTDLTGLNPISIRDLELADLTQLPSIASLGTVGIARHITLTNLPALTSLTGLDGLAKLGLDEGNGGELVIDDVGIESLEGLGNLGSGGTPVKSIALRGLVDLQSLAGLGAQQVNHLELTSLPPDGLDGLPEGLTVNHLTVAVSADYPPVDSPSSLAALAGISVAKSLTLDGLANLRTFTVDAMGPTLRILDALTIRRCGIEELGGTGLVHIKEALTLEDNDALTGDALAQFTTNIKGALAKNGKLRLGTGEGGYTVSLTGLGRACAFEVTNFIDNLLDKRGSDNGTTNDDNGGAVAATCPT